ncbi:hypothetical protein TWF694_002371 [Orbilia ellipsospora]|uniref:F-box domain-containing protein n=1 Tax=Orbilia ellipsospora TaxID=2528407 RepID=A0AAV9X1R9_9PEZI
MARKNIESLPYDIFLHILSLIDDKADLDNLCLALPHSASRIVSKHPTLLDRLYRAEIRDHFLLPAALLNFRFNRSHEAAAVLEKLDPLGLASPYHSQLVINGNGYNNGYDSDSDSDTDEDDIGSLGGDIYDDEEEEDSERLVNIRVMQSISEQTATQMKYIHTRIERLAQIFMKYQLDKHQQTETATQKCRPPTADERRRVIKAVYNAWLVVITRLFAMLGASDDGNSGVPGVDRKLYINLTTAWEFWETKEVGTILEVLWKEIPVQVIDLASEGGFSAVGQRWVIKEENRRYYISSPLDLIDFAFTGGNWNLDKHIQLLECHGDEKRAKEFLINLVTTDEDSKRIFTIGTSSAVTARTNLISKCEERIRSVIRTAWNKENSVHQNQDRFCTPPARRLVDGRNGTLEVVKYEERGSSRETNWTTMAQVKVKDCVWDDWRLEGWGYHFPEFVYPPRRRRMGALGMDDEQRYVPRQWR